MNKYQIKYLEQKGGTSDSRIEDTRPNRNPLSFARVHTRTDIVLQIGQKYVFQRIGGPDIHVDQIQIRGNRFIPININFEFEQLEYLGQKKIRLMDRADNLPNLDKRRNKVENIIDIEPRDQNDEFSIDTAIVFNQMHAFKRLNGTGEVLMLYDDQVSDQICL